MGDGKPHTLQLGYNTKVSTRTLGSNRLPVVGGPVHYTNPDVYTGVDPIALGITRNIVPTIWPFYTGLWGPLVEVVVHLSVLLSLTKDSCGKYVDLGGTDPTTEDRKGNILCYLRENFPFTWIQNST